MLPPAPPPHRGEENACQWAPSALLNVFDYCCFYSWRQEEEEARDEGEEDVCFFDVFYALVCCYCCYPKRDFASMNQNNLSLMALWNWGAS